MVTEKLDGENTALYADGVHARSPDSGHHPSRAWMKGLQGRIAPRVPAGRRICGEILHARHSPACTDLDGWFYGFSVWTAEDRCPDRDATVRFLRRLGAPAPRVLWRGRYDERAIRALKPDPERQEGYVVRTAAGFDRDGFGRRAAKWVRPHRVRTDTHRMHAAVVENGLGPNAALWHARSGGAPDADAPGDALGTPLLPELDRFAARLDALGRTGDARLPGVLAIGPGPTPPTPATLAPLLRHTLPDVPTRHLPGGDLDL